MMVDPSCVAMACPRLRNIDLSIQLAISEVSRDVLGNIWCNYCHKQRLLMNYAHAHGWPAVRVQGQMWYAICAGQSDWYASVACGKQDMIDALYRELIEEQTQQIA